MNTKIELEALITEREGMLAENTHRIDCGHSIAYGDESFFDLAQRICALSDQKPLTKDQISDLNEKHGYFQFALEKIYKEETGNNAMYEMEDPKNCNQSDLYYYDAYVEWREEYHDSLFAVLEKIIEAHKMSEVDWDAMREAEKLLLRTKRNA